MLSEIVETYFQSRPNRNLPRDKIAVLFLACSGSGKSTITQKIVDELGATYLRNDDARQLLREHNLDLSPKLVIDKTWERMRQESKNQFLVFDSNMSAYYMHDDSYYNVALREGYRTFIIAIAIPKDQLEQRIHARQRYDTAAVIDLLPEQLIAQQKAMAALQPNFVTLPNTDNEEIIKALRSFGSS